MLRVYIESPYAGDVLRNIRYAKACVKDSLARGEAPFASHLFYTQENILRDYIRDERRLGIEAGMMWQVVADLVAVYTDLGISAGMRVGIDNAERLGLRIDYRRLGHEDF